MTALRYLHFDPTQDLAAQTHHESVHVHQEIPLESFLLERKQLGPHWIMEELISP